jgi:hypothetical protein
MNKQARFLVQFLIVAGIALASMQSAQAIAMQVVTSNIRQNGFTANVSLGHTVLASSNMNRLIAGGTFDARCPSSHTGSIPGQRTLPAQSLVGGTRLTVTIPEWVPAVRAMPGFENVPGGTTLDCTYNWTAQAEEATYSVGVPGLGMTIGGERLVDSGVVHFEMYKPGSSGEVGSGCIH